LEQIGSLTKRIKDYERQLERISKERYPETDLLPQLEGIGPLTALTFVLTLEDPYRFAKSRSVGAYSLGLVPATDQSGDRDSFLIRFASFPLSPKQNRPTSFSEIAGCATSSPRPS
jgi:transposase